MNDGYVGFTNLLKMVLWAGGEAGDKRFINFDYTSIYGGRTLYTCMYLYLREYQRLIGGLHKGLENLFGNVSGSWVVLLIAAALPLEKNTTFAC